MSDEWPHALPAHSLISRLVGHVFLAVALSDHVADFGNSNISQRHGVGTHVGNQAYQPLAGQLDAFVEFLRNAHRALGVETQFPRCFLLQCRGREGCGGVAAALALVDAENRELTASGLEQCLFNLTRGCFVLEAELFDLFALVTDEARDEGLLVLADVGFDRPVFARFERFDLEFALDDHAERRALHAAG
jgi:hypothetical protein